MQNIGQKHPFEAVQGSSGPTYVRGLQCLRYTSDGSEDNDDNDGSEETEAVRGIHYAGSTFLVINEKKNVIGFANLYTINVRSDFLLVRMRIFFMKTLIQPR